MKYNKHIVKKDVDLSIIPAKHNYLKELLFKRGYLRLSPPAYGFKKGVTPEDNAAFFVWREIMFNISEHEGHRRFPLMGLFYLQLQTAPDNFVEEQKLSEKEITAYRENNHVLVNELIQIAHGIVAQFPRSRMQHEPAHWGRAVHAA